MAKDPMAWWEERDEDRRERDTAITMVTRGAGLSWPAGFDAVMIANDLEHRTDIQVRDGAPHLRISCDQVYRLAALLRLLGEESLAGLDS